MHFFVLVFHWFTTSSHWHGVDGIPHRLTEHVEMSLAASVTAAAIALPIGIGLGHTGRGGVLAVNVSNIGRAIPSFAVLVIGLQVFGLGAEPAFVALVVLAVPPMLTNAYVGMQSVEPELRQAATAMGMTGWQSLRKVELPLAVPLVMAGVRTATVQVVATATLAALISWGGLGRYIVFGIDARDNVEVFAGALLVALLSLVTEVGLAALQRAVTPTGLRRSSGVVKNEPFVGAGDALAIADA